MSCERKIDSKKLAKGLLCLVAFVLFSTQLSAQQDTDLPNEFGTALGVYKLNAASEFSAFETFDSFFLKKFRGQETPGNVLSAQVDGRLVLKDGTVYRFDSAELRRRETGEVEFIEFITVKVDGISFSFKGRYMEEKTQVRPGGDYTMIRGILTRHENGRKIKSENLPFFQYGEM